MVDYDNYEEEFSVKSTLSRCSWVFSELLPIVVGLTLMAEAIGFLGDLMGSFGGILGIAGTVIGLATQGSISLAIVKNYQEREVEFKECLSKGVCRLPTLLLACLLIFLIVVALSIPVSIIFVVTRSLSLNSLFMAIVVVGLAGFAFWLFAMLSLTIQIIVVEELGAIEAMRRSKELTKGHRGSIMFLYFLIFALVIVLMYVGYLIFGAMFSLPNLASVEGFQQFAFKLDAEGGSMSVMFYLIIFIITSVSRVFSNVMGGAIYLELLIVKADKDIDEMAQVFE
jgi:hypothetical protein